MAPKTVDEYVKSLKPDQVEIVSTLRKVILQAAPQAKESFKWAQPVYEQEGPFCYIKAFSSAVNFGFWRGVDLDDPGGRLEGSGNRMRHFKLTQAADIDEKLITRMVKQAVKLNTEKGDPTRR